ncbi:MAG: asparagine synthase (glutamine-hydrolyzing) [Candidatus Xenobia bacterium]
MCGIAGFAGGREAPVGLLEAMRAALHHRGPDDGGQIYCKAPAGLAMQRLSIIDLEGGHQPLASADGTAWIVFNGEIYNHPELRRRLEGYGLAFRTRSDTEVILQAWRRHGVECVQHLRGMFGFAIFDSIAERLLLARDPIGIKPLFWTVHEDRLLFASEIKALLRAGVPRRVDRESLHHYLTYLYVPPPRTMFEGIHQLPPGHRLTWQSGQSHVERYWEGPSSLTDAPGAPLSAQAVWDSLRDSVAAHMLSDVPVGAFLSGGIDSSLIVKLMAEASSNRIKTFAIGFRDAGLYDELPHARQVAEHIGTDHYETTMEPDAVALLPRVLRHLDEPLADASVLPNYLVAELAHQHVKVALTGIGGDELFGGYRRYAAHGFAERWRRVPRWLRSSVLLPALRSVPPTGDTRLGNLSRLAQKFLEPLDLPPEKRYLSWNTYFAESAKQALYQNDHGYGDSLELPAPFFAAAAKRPFAEQAMYVDLCSYLPGDPLMLSDRMTMAHSLEARVPLVDVEVIDMAFRMPLEQKLAGSRTKIVLRQLLEAHLPASITKRPKQGFGTPIDLWLNRELRSLVSSALSPQVLRARGYFRPAYVEWLYEQQRHGRRDFSQHIWALLVFELWHRMYIDQDLSARSDVTFADLDLAPARRAATGMRILMVADVDPAAVQGGAERMLDEHARRLAARGHDVVVLTRQESGMTAEQEHHGYRIVRHPVQEGPAPVFMRSVLREGARAARRLVAQGRFDLINVHQPLAGAAVLRALQGTRMLYTYLSPWGDEYWTRHQNGSSGLRRAWHGVNRAVRRSMEQRVVQAADRLLVLSHFTATQLDEIHHVPDSRISQLPGGVDADRFRPVSDRVELRRRLQLPETGGLLLTVRNLVPRMGLEALIAAFKTIVETHPTAHLYIGGSGSLREPLERQVAATGLSDRVRFTGFIPDAELPLWYAAADAFVLPTRCLEGFGLVTIESLACGTPVVGTPIGSTPEILSRLDPALILPGTDADAIARGLLALWPRLTGDPDLRRQCRLLVEQHYAWDVIIPQLETLMQRLNRPS